MFSFLNLSFDFTESNNNSSDNGSKSVKPAEEQSKWVWEGFSSPLTSAATLTPRSESFFTPPPAKKPVESREARTAEICPEQGVKKRRSIRNKQRRSSVFFKLPDLDKVLKGGGGEDKEKAPPPRAGGVKGSGKKWADVSAQSSSTLASKFSRPGSSRRRSRRASVAPGGCSPGRTRADRAAAEERLRESNLHPPSPIGAAAAAAAAAAGEAVLSWFDSNDPRGGGGGGGGGRSGTVLLTVGEDAPAAGGVMAAASSRQDHAQEKPQKRPSPRSSPRALSAGHRRESCRDSRVISRAPKGLTAARLLEDAQDVGRIRQQANLRAKMEGVCWVASNWRVGGRKGVLSGKRFLVLCDNIVWAELREADRRCSLGEGGGGTAAGGRKQAGFMPIIALEGAVVQHHEVATSNNGWVIEVINPGEDVTLWLDPENPTALLRWGSVLCQALEQTLNDDDDADDEE